MGWLSDYANRDNEIDSGRRAPCVTPLCDRQVPVPTVAAVPPALCYRCALHVLAITGDQLYQDELGWYVLAPEEHGPIAWELVGLGTTQFTPPRPTSRLRYVGPTGEPDNRRPRTIWYRPVVTDAD